MLVFCQAIPGCVPWGVMNTYFNDYMAQDRGLGVQDSTQLLLAFGSHRPVSLEDESGADYGRSRAAAESCRSVSFSGAGTAVGTVAGGFVAQWLYNRHKWHMPILMGVTTITVRPASVAISPFRSFETKRCPAVGAQDVIITGSFMTPAQLQGIFPILYLVNGRVTGEAYGVSPRTTVLVHAPLRRTPISPLRRPDPPLPCPQTAVFAAFGGGVLSCVTAGNVRAVLLNVNAPECRGSAFAIYALMARVSSAALPALSPRHCGPASRSAPCRSRS